MSPRHGWFVGLLALSLLTAGCSSLGDYVRVEDAEGVRLLLAKGVDPNQRLPNSQTPLMLAAAKGYSGIVQMLQRKGADVNAADHDGFTALMAAAYNNHADVAKMLIDGHANVNALHSNGRTALWFAVTNRNTDLIRALLDAGADPTLGASNPSTGSPMMLAEKAGRADIIGMLRGEKPPEPVKPTPQPTAPETPSLATLLTQAPQEWLTACDRAAHLWFEYRQALIQPNRLVAFVSSCVTVLHAVPPDAAAKATQCLLAGMKLDCTSGLGMQALFGNALPSATDLDTTQALALLPSEGCDEPSDRQPPNCVHYETSGEEGRPVLALHVYRMILGDRREVHGDLKADMERASAVCTSASACQAACKALDHSACALLGYRYWEADGVPRDEARGTKLMRDGCSAGNKLACSIIAFFSNQVDRCTDEAACTTLCTRSIWAACIRAGDIARQQSGPGRTRAFGYFKRACDGGHAGGCNATGAAYMQGWGVMRNISQAAVYFRKACSGGNSEACLNVTGVECVTAATATRLRAPSLDPFCNPYQGRPARSGAPMPMKAYQAGDGSTDFESMTCFQPLLNSGCHATRSQRLDKSAWCCP